MASVIDTVVNLAKRRGFVFPAGEIYGGTKSAWDYGPLGVELKENIKRQWWRSVVTGRDDVVGLDSSIILPREVWVASGHVEVFNDPLVESLITHKRYRADHLIEAYEAKHGHPPPNGLADIRDPETGEPGQWTEPREFNMMLKTYLGPIETEEGLHYLRPETAQGIFVNFANVVTTARRKPPFGIGQIGKSFRNEITPGNFIFRTREFEQMEMEFFVEPSTAKEWHQYWIDTRLASGTSTSVSTRRTCGSTNTRRTSCRTTPTAPSTSSTSSASPATRGASWKASPTGPTSTYPRTQSIPVSICRSMTRSTTPATCRMSSNRRPV